VKSLGFRPGSMPRLRLPLACPARAALLRCLATLAFATATLASAAATAQDARVRASVAGDEQVWVGQRVTVVVELLAPGYFASAAQFDIPDPAGVLLMPPQGHPVVGNETIDGLLYTVQRHELLAWPMRAGGQSIPAVTARFSFKRNPLDKDEIPAAVTTRPMPFAVSLPPGAEGLGTVISARDLDIRDVWNPEPGGEEIKAGAAYTRTITFTAPDVPGMVFPPFRPGEMDGLATYAKQHIQDSENRGALTGARRDEITYVFQRPGQYTVPAVKLTWFDLAAQALQTEVLPAQNFNVVANPGMASADTGQAATSPDSRALGNGAWRTLAGAFALVLLAYFAAKSQGLRQRIERWAALFRPVRLQTLNPNPFNPRRRP
jgi:hypothetical protein